MEPISGGFICCFTVISSWIAAGFVSKASRAGHGRSTRGRRRATRAWNAELRDSVVLPLVPSVLHDAVDSKMASPAQLVEVVTAVAGSSWFHRNRDAICARNTLVRVLEAPSALNWRLVPSEVTCDHCKDRGGNTTADRGTLHGHTFLGANPEHPFVCGRERCTHERAGTLDGRGSSFPVLLAVVAHVSIPRARTAARGFSRCGRTE